MVKKMTYGVKIIYLKNLFIFLSKSSQMYKKCFSILTKEKEN